MLIESELVAHVPTASEISSMETNEDTVESNSNEDVLRSDSKSNTAAMNKLSSSEPDSKEKGKRPREFINKVSPRLIQSAIRSTTGPQKSTRLQSEVGSVTHNESDINTKPTMSSLVQNVRKSFAKRGVSDDGPFQSSVLCKKKIAISVLDNYYIYKYISAHHKYFIKLMYYYYSSLLLLLVVVLLL